MDMISERIQSANSEFGKNFNAIHQFVAIIDEGKIVCINLAGVKIMGFQTEKSLIGRSLCEFMDREYAEVLEHKLGILLDEPEGLPLKLKAATGNKVDAKMWVTRWPKGDPSSDEFLVEIHDYSAHMRAAQTLRAQEQYLSQIISAVADGIVTVDEQGIVTTFNKAAETIFGRSFTDAVGTHINAIIPELTYSAECDGEQTPHQDVFFERTDGSSVWIECVGRWFSVGESHTLTWLVHDITERKLLDDQRQQVLLEAEDQRARMEEQAIATAELAEEYYTMKSKAESADKLKSRFLANMSHELRTPLNAIIGFSEVMKEEMFGPVKNQKYVQYLRHIHSSGSYLLNLINDILDISKVEAGAQDLCEDNINIQDVVSDCLEMVRERARKSSVTVGATIPDDFPLLYADQVRIKQILLNLLTNAIKFSKKGGKVSVQIDIDELDRVVVQVSDDGVGVAPEDMKTAFEPFGQVADTMTREQEGTGLGLPLCKSFTELHGGELSFESELGKGSIVTLLFPPDRTLGL